MKIKILVSTDVLIEEVMKNFWIDYKLRNIIILFGRIWCVDIRLNFYNTN